MNPQSITNEISDNDNNNNVQLALNTKQKQLIENRTLFFNLIAETTTLDDCNTNGDENNKQQATNLFTKYENEIRTNVNELFFKLT